MSMISEQIYKLRSKSHLFHKNSQIYKLLTEAADTIEELSAKLASANRERSEKYSNMDLVDVIRCKDCRQWGTGFPAETEFVKVCKYGGYMIGATGYCLYAERK